MKGIIFTEFIEMVEEKFGFVISDRIIGQAQLPSEGIYTAVGTYAFNELVSLVTQLSQETGTPIPELLFSFGHHLFGRFHAIYPHFFEGKTGAFDLLDQIEDYIHVEVLKLYPDARLPAVITEISQDGQQMKMTYRSSRKMSDLARGLIHGCKDHFDEDFSLETLDITNDGEEVTFLLSKK